MTRNALAIAAAASAVALAASAASAAPASIAANNDVAGLVHKAGSVYIDIGPPRYYRFGGYDGDYFDRPYYPSYGYYGPRRYYGSDYEYRPYKHSRRWVKERFEHPLGRR